MGGSQSKNNDDLVDLLVGNGHIKSIDIERVFRLVDRGRFFPEEYKEEAYKESPFKVPDTEEQWNPGRFHISAPSMYAQVVEKLELRPGLSFLNIGSGSGWLNTTVGFLLGSNGINHGIEVHQNLVEFSIDRLGETMGTPEISCFSFTAPVFFHGNALSQLPTDKTRYDRIYCGAAVNDMKSVYRLIQFLDIGGRMVAPVDHMLMCYIRTSEKRFLSQRVIACQFADLVASTKEDRTAVLPPLVRPFTLQRLCRSFIRSMVRECVRKENPLVIRSLCADGPNIGGGRLTGPHIVYIHNADAQGHVRVNVVAGEENNGRIRLLPDMARLRVVIPPDQHFLRDQDGELHHLAGDGHDLLVHEEPLDGGRLDMHELPEEGVEEEPQRPAPLPERRIFFDDEDEEEEDPQPVIQNQPPPAENDAIPEDDDAVDWPVFADEVDAVHEHEAAQIALPPQDDDDNASEGSSSSDDVQVVQLPEGGQVHRRRVEVGGGVNQVLAPIVWGPRDANGRRGRPVFLSNRRLPQRVFRPRGDSEDGEEEDADDSSTAKRRKMEPPESKTDRAYRLQRESIRSFSDVFKKRIDDLQPMPIPLTRYLKFDF